MDKRAAIDLHNEAARRHNEEGDRLLAVIGDAVRQRRQELDLTQNQLATLADLSEGSIRNVESGTVEPRSRTWTSIQAVLGWAPGSLDAIQKRMSPVEVLPVEMLKDVINELIFGQNSEVNTLRAIRDFREAMSAVNERGEFTAQDAKRFVNFVNDFGMFLVEDNVEYGQVDDEDFVVVNDGGYEHHKEFIRRLEASLKIGASSGASDAATLRRLWPEVLVRLREIKRTPWSLISQESTVADVSDGVLTLAFRKPNLRDTFASRKDFQDYLRQAIKEVLGVDLRIEAIIDPSAGVYRRYDTAAALPKELEEALRDAQIIDYSTFKYTLGSEIEDSNLRVVTILVKEDPDRPFSPADIDALRHFQKVKRVGFRTFKEEEGGL